MSTNQQQAEALVRMNRVARARALVKHLQEVEGNTGRAERLADKVFGKRGWTWSGVYYRSCLLCGEWK